MTCTVPDLVRRENEQGPFINFVDSRPFTRERLVSQLRTVLAEISIKPDQFAGHNFPHWGATMAAAFRIKCLVIKMLGQWESFTYQRYSKFLIIWIQIIQILDYSNAWMSPCFQRQQENDILVTQVLLQEKAKLLYEWLCPDATMPFSASTGFRSWFTTSELAEWSRKHCSTVWQTKRWGK